MGRLRCGTVERDACGRLVARVTVCVRTNTRIVKRRPRIVLPSGSTAREAKRFALGLSAELNDRILTEDEYQRLVQQRPLGRAVRDFVEHVYLPRRAALAAVHYDPLWWRLHILPILGDEDVATFSAEPLRQLVTYLDGRAADTNTKFTQKTATNIWGLVRRFCSDLQSSKDSEVRIRTDNPALAVQGPDHGD